MSSHDAAPEGRSLSAGFGRLVVLAYVVFAVSAGVRAGFQVATKFDHAPISYSLSALAALIYLVAAIAIVRGAAGVALAAVSIDCAHGSVSVSGRQRASASINFNTVRPRYFSRTTSGADTSMALIWLITAVRCLTAERRARCSARNPAVASSFGAASPSPANAVRAAL